MLCEKKNASSVLYFLTKLYVLTSLLAKNTVKPQMIGNVLTTLLFILSKYCCQIQILD